MKRLLLSLLLLTCATAPAEPVQPARAKNVILFLADAGGIPTLNAASLHGYGAPQKLFVQTWTDMGLSDTTPAGAWVTDSAAGMTALVTGEKTHNGVISQAADAVRGQSDGRPPKTILEYAEEWGLSTGVVSNMAITDATPAACYAHANDRRKWGEIFLQVFTPRYGDGVDVLIGPGRQRIFDQVRELGKDPDEVARAANRPAYSSLKEIPPDSRRALAVMDGDFDFSEAVILTLEALAKNPKGYFLMVESDAHTNNPDKGLGRLVAFDRLIQNVAARVNLNETLLLFTADHSFDLRVRSGRPGETLLKGLEEWKQETGGKGKEMKLPYVRVDDAHTGEEVLVAAKGAGAGRVRGFMPNTRIFEIMMQAFGRTPTAP